VHNPRFAHLKINGLPGILGSINPDLHFLVADVDARVTLLGVLDVYVYVSVYL